MGDVVDMLRLSKGQTSFFRAHGDYEFYADYQSDQENWSFSLWLKPASEVIHIGETPDPVRKFRDLVRRGFPRGLTNYATRGLC